MAIMSDILINYYKKKSAIDFKCIKGLASAKTWEDKHKVVQKWKEERNSLKF